MKNTVKILALVMAAVMLLLLTGCQNAAEKPQETKVPEATQAPAAEPAPEATAEPAPEAAAEPAAEPAPEVTAEPAAEPATAAGEPVSYAGQVLNVYNWGEYIDMEVIYEFERRYGVKVNYDRFSSNEDMYTKLITGASYDVVVPSDYMIERLIREDQLQPIDKNIVTNLPLLYPGVANLDYDPDNTWSVPYLWQNVGIVYDTTKISPEKIEQMGYSIFLDPEYDGHAYMYDSERDSFMIAFKALGYSCNTENEDEINAAFEWLRQVDRTVHPAYVTDEVIDSMCNGEKWMAIVYSGDAAYILSENPNMSFCAPAEGTNIAVDAMVIPKNAKNPALANVFINYILEYDVSKAISEEVGYASSNAQVLAELSGEGGTYADNVAYLPRSGYEKDEFFHDNETLRKRLSELWIKVKLHE